MRFCFRKVEAVVYRDGNLFVVQCCAHLAAVVFVCVLLHGSGIRAYLLPM